MRGLSEVSRRLFDSPPPPPSPPPPRILKEAHRGVRVAADVLEAVQQDELHALQIPVLDMRLLNAIINKRMAVLKQEYEMDKLGLLAAYTKRLARPVTNPEKWRRISERYEARLSVLTAAMTTAWSRAHVVPV